MRTDPFVAKTLSKPGLHLRMLIHDAVYPRLLKEIITRPYLALYIKVYKLFFDAS